MPTKPAPIDASSGDVVLAYAGGRAGRDVPSRDLSGADLGRIAFRRALRQANATRSHRVEPGAKRQGVTRPGQPDADTLTALADELIASSAFAAYEPTEEPVLEPSPPEPIPPPQDPPPAAPDDDGGPA